jgi:hypothetical protein
MVNCYAFDIDHTLEISNGPVKLSQLVNLRNQGHIIGVVGNFGLFMDVVVGWHQLICFWNIQEGMDKAATLRWVKRSLDRPLMHHTHIDHYIMVGNEGTGWPMSADKEAATAAGWEFIKEEQFKEGL